MDEQDRTLVRQFLEGNRDAANGLVDRYQKRLFNLALRMTGDVQDAEDVTQAVLILFSQKAAGLSLSVVIPGWLFRTTRYVCLHAMKKQQRRQRHEQQAARARPEGSEPGDAITWQELSPSIDQALMQIKQRYRDALVLRLAPHGHLISCSKVPPLPRSWGWPRSGRTSCRQRCRECA